MDNRKPTPKGASIWFRVVSVASVFAIMLSLSLVLNSRILGTKPGAPAPDVAVMSEADDGSTVVNTASLGADVEGYAGTIPLKIVISEGKVASIEALPNDETPSFFDKAFADLAGKWQGKDVAAAAAVDVDAYSGATYSSDAIIENVRRGLAYYMQHSDMEASPVAASHHSLAGSAGWWAAIVVALCAAVLPFFIRSKAYRVVQLLANVGVLGFWTGTFLSYTVIFSLISGAPRAELIPAWLLLAIAFLMPLFGSGNRYCAWVCPLGSLQELAGMCGLPKLHLPVAALKALTWLRRILWGVLMMLLWSGLFVQWLDYELFMAFVIPTAPEIVLWVAGAFVLLSFFVGRPFCRFVCPVGSIIDLSSRSTDN